MSSWTHPFDRPGASPELNALERAWVGLGDYPEGSRQYAACAAIMDAFEAANPGFDRVQCLTAEWRQERDAAWAAEAAQRDSAAGQRKTAVEAAVMVRNWAKLVTLAVRREELPDAAPGTEMWKAAQAARSALVWGRGEKAVGVKK